MAASRLLLVTATLAGLFMGQSSRTRPVAQLEPAPKLEFPAPTDSNSPAFWRLRHGESTLAVLNSTGAPVLGIGSDIEDVVPVGPAEMNRGIEGGWWMESVVPDFRGVLYGYYHNEQADICPGVAKAAPRIGAARSFDGGRTWSDLGFVLEAPPESARCQTSNRYFVGGVGDFSVILDRDKKYLYVFFSAYLRDLDRQGVGVARLRWSDRDKPVGRVAVWDSGVWRYPEADDEGRFTYPWPRPFLAASRSWHERTVDAFWGPSVHWNTFLEQYVMLLNRARDGTFAQEGIYLSVAASLDNPAEWSPPNRLLTGGKWYPQVIGLEPGSGTDRLAGQRARLFVGGTSEHEIVFQLPENVSSPR
jgi:hypothetical protein